MKITRTVSESGGLPARHIDAFLDRLRAAHYSEVTLRKKRRVLCAFSRWMKNRNIDLIDFDYPPWHTAEDTMDKISAESLQTVGRVVVYYLIKFLPK